MVAEGMAIGRRRAGFTLVELMVVVIIIGILAAAATPIYYSQTRRARQVEATDGLGAIRQAERVYSTERGVYLAVSAGDMGNDPNGAPPGLGLDFSKNTYYDQNCFSVVLDATYGFVVTCDGTAGANNAPRKAQINTVQAQGRADGTCRYSHDSGGSWTNWE